MSGNTNNPRLRTNATGVTVFELMLVTAIASFVIAAITTVMISFYGGVVATNTEARLAVESQGILQEIVEDLRVSSSIRPNNAINDPHAPDGGWTTSNDNLILIISTPALTSSNEYVTDPLTGRPYQNELVYFAIDNQLFRRTLANPNVSDNTMKTTCPETAVSSSCPGDALFSDNFSDMHFVFYDQDDNVTNNISAARSIQLTINMYKQNFGREITFDNTIRITLRSVVS